MAHGERLGTLDDRFLQMENGITHMHVGACAIFAGPAPAYEDLVDLVAARLSVVPRYRQLLRRVPLGQGRPVWVDDPQFRLPFHIRHTALPHPGTETQLRRLAGRIFSQELDRGRPLWEIWLVEGLEQDRFALIFKTHHALIDGVSSVDLASVIFDPDGNSEPDAETARAQAAPWLPRPLPSSAELLADALIERIREPREAVRSLAQMPAGILGRVGTTVVGVGALAWAGLEPAPRSPFNVRIGPHRRFTWVDAELDDLRTVKRAFGSSVNDAVLAAVAGALGAHLRRHDLATDGLVLKALVPVSVDGPNGSGAAPSLGGEVAAIWAPLPVGITDPAQLIAYITAAMAAVRFPGEAIGAQTLSELAGFASPTLVAQAARLQARQRLFNLVVTNVPGPQRPLRLIGRTLHAIYPLVPLAANTALGIAVLSYNGQMNFGICSDYDALSDVELLAQDLRESISALVQAARAER